MPVLSMHSTSTLLSDSIAFTCWASAPRLAIVAAPIVYASAAMKKSP